MVTQPRPVQLFLFVAGSGSNAMSAIASLRRALDEMVDKRFSLEIVNVHEAPDRAIASRVLVTPTLLAEGFTQRLVGDLSETLQLRYFLQALS